GGIFVLLSLVRERIFLVSVAALDALEPVRARALAHGPRRLPPACRGHRPGPAALRPRPPSRLRRAAAASAPGQPGRARGTDTFRVDELLQLALWRVPQHLRVLPLLPGVEVRGRGRLLRPL